jgi:NADH-quinone oxidoreductase subunit L
MAAALMTAFYSWRLLFLTFHGESRADEKTLAHVHESPRSMTVPLIILAIGAVFAGMAGYEAMVGEFSAGFWGKSILVLPSHDALAHAHHVPEWVKLGPVALALIGIGLAWIAYIANPDLPRLIVARVRGLYLFLYNKWYFDELYDAIFVRPAHFLGYGLWKQGDGAVIDGVGPDGIAAAAKNLAAKASRLQTGYLYHYAFAMLAAVAVLVTWYLVRRG